MSPGSPSNICFVNTNNGWGGGEKWHLDHAEYLTEKSYNVVLITRKNSDLHEKAEQAGIRTFSMHVRGLSFLNIYKISRLYHFFQEKQIEVVIINGPSDFKLVGLAAKLAGVPNIIYRRGLAKPIGRNFINSFLLKKAIHFLMVNSRHTEEIFLEKYPELRRNLKIKLLYNGVQVDAKSVLERSPKKRSGKFILGNASRLSYEKGHDLLILAAGELVKKGIDFTLVIAGEGSLGPRLRHMVREQGLEKHIVFNGFVEDIPRFMEDIDLYLCTSRYEGFGYSIAEAMMAEKPVVAFKTGSLPELIVDGETGFLVEPFDIALLAEKTMTLIQHKDLYTRLGKAGKERAVVYFNKETQLKKFEEFLQEEL
ncbi:MAG: glycosyltransferase [Cyclobacteriaceae bacterium]|nr:glycosyltransferase [Cyclobacteriaceae bacterium]